MNLHVLYSRLSQADIIGEGYADNMAIVGGCKKH